MAEHDLLFKHAFRTKEGARALLASVLPEDLLALVDLDSVELVEANLVDAALSERFADALLRLDFASGAARLQGYVRVLLEHQSTPLDAAPLRALDYSTRRWANEHREAPASLLGPILCVVVYHGKSPWAAPRRFHDLFGPLGALARFVPSFEILVDDLSSATNDDLAARPLPVFQRLVLWCLRDSRSLPTLLENLAHFGPDLERLAQTSPEDTITLLRYILQVSGDLPVQQIQTRIVTTAPSTEHAMQSAAEQLIHEGFCSGKAEGKAEGVLTVLEARGIAVPPEQRAKILACTDAPTLDLWLRAAATCATADALFTH